MAILDIILIAFALAMDCFAVSIVSGIIVMRFDWKTMLRMALLFGAFQGLMPLIGYFCGFYFKAYIESYDHWIALVILAILGVKMIREGMSSEEENEERSKSICPLRWGPLLMMAVATSIDALATGIVFVPFPHIIWIGVGIIAIASFVMSLIGSYIGVHFGDKINFKVEILGGIILIGIGVKIFVEHFFFLDC